MMPIADHTVIMRVAVQSAKIKALKVVSCCQTWKRTVITYQRSVDYS